MAFANDRSLLAGEQDNQVRVLAKLRINGPDRAKECVMDCVRNEHELRCVSDQRRILPLAGRRDSVGHAVGVEVTAFTCCDDAPAGEDQPIRRQNGHQ